MARREIVQDGRQWSGLVEASVAPQGTGQPGPDKGDLHISRVRKDQVESEPAQQNPELSHRLATRRAVGNRSRARPDLYSASARRWRRCLEIRQNR